MSKRAQNTTSEASQKSSDAAWSDGYRTGAVEGLAIAVDLVLGGVVVGLAERRPVQGSADTAQALVDLAVRRFGWDLLQPELARRLSPEDLARLTPPTSSIKEGPTP